MLFKTAFLQLARRPECCIRLGTRYAGSVTYGSGWQFGRTSLSMLRLLLSGVNIGALINHLAAAGNAFKASKAEKASSNPTMMREMGGPNNL